MGFFDNFLGGIKKAGSSVVGAIKTAGKKVGDVGQSAMDFSREKGIASAIQTAGTGIPYCKLYFIYIPLR